MDIELVRKRIEVVKKSIKLLLNRTDFKRIREMQQRYGAERGKITLLHLNDIDINICFRIKDGKLQLMKDVENPDNRISAPSDLYFSLFQKDPDEVIREAVNWWRYGDLTMTGETAMVDFKLFIRAIKDIKDSLPKPQVPTAAEAPKQATGV